MEYNENTRLTKYTLNKMMKQQSKNSNHWYFLSVELMNEEYRFVLTWGQGKL